MTKMLQVVAGLTGATGKRTGLPLQSDLHDTGCYVKDIESLSLVATRKKKKKQVSKAKKENKLHLFKKLSYYTLKFST